GSEPEEVETKMPLKFEGLAKVGDKIRAYDHQPRDTNSKHYYVEGFVLDANAEYPIEKYKCYLIGCYKDTVYRPYQSRVGERVYVPFELGFFEWDDRVSLVKENENV